VIEREAIRRALINLVRNALQASPEGGVVGVALERRDGRARVVVTDEGAGLDPEIAGRVFDPFVTARAEGTGLGLALVKRVAEEHGGSVALRNRPGGGAEAILEIGLEGEGA
jgi:signal transduction histidine kinase